MLEMGNKRMRIKRIPVSEDFSRWLKVRAAENGCSVLEYSKKFAKKQKKEGVGNFEFTW